MTLIFFQGVLCEEFRVRPVGSCLKTNSVQSLVASRSDFCYPLVRYFKIIDKYRNIATFLSTVKKIMMTYGVYNTV